MDVSEVDPMLHSTLNEIERQKKRMRTKLSPRGKAVDTRMLETLPPPGRAPSW
jgi:hypothetical protein